ncbi:MAG: cytochrome c3 family protein [Deltaproteobacteria bacterium]|nr:cytochrome c3 family protein [Deltaproteobacteria bacterium]
MMRVRWLAILFLPSFAACAWWMAGRPGSAKLGQLLFNHAIHKEQSVECTTCHAGVDAATDTSAGYTPKEAVCMDCHDRDNDCTKCHGDPATPRVPVPHESELGFSHQKHLSQEGVTCSKCHPDGETSTALPIILPKMDLCLNSCHNHEKDYAEGRCTGCHPALDRLPLKAVAEFTHSGDWQGGHGLQAAGKGAACLQCHPQTFCSECHARSPAAVNARLYPEDVKRALLHRADWLTTHPIEARADGDTCLRCHRDPSYCAACHTQSGVTNRAANPRVPHPAGYAVRGNAAFHGDDARLHIETCAACHDQGAASNCVQCHKVGGIGGNPHPAGFIKRHDAGQATTEKMCQACHVNN